MVLFVSWTSVITETSGEASTITSSNILELLKGVIAVWSQDRITNDTMKDKCPQLYSLTDNEFEEGRSKGILGSLEKLDKLCPNRNSSELSLPCQGAIGISSYLCNASAGFRKNSGSADWPSPAEDTNLSQTSSSKLLCGSIQNSNLTEKLLAYLKKNPTVQAFNISSIPMSETKCTEACDGDHLYLCRMILQGLKTVEKWENLKDHPEDSKYSPSNEGEVAQGNDSKAQLVPEQNASNSTVQSPSTVVSQNLTIVEPKDATATAQIQKPATTDNGSIQKGTKSDNSSNASSAAVTVPPGVPSKQLSPDPKTNSAEQESKAQQETQQSPTSEAKETANTSDVQQLKSDEVDDLEKEKERKDEESLTDLDSEAYPPDEDDSDIGMDEAEQTAVKPPPQKEESHSPPTSNEFLDEPEDTHFLVYFIVFVTLTVACYILYVRRNRFLALFIEGRNGSSSRRRSVSRPSASGYRKLVNNLEEVITSSQSVSKSNVIY